jgi:hypothetical protein
MSLQDVGCQATPLFEDGCEDMDRLDIFTRADAPFGARDDAAYAWRHEDSIPEAIVARSERATHVGKNVRGPHTSLRKTSLHARIVFFDECE